MFPIILVFGGKFSSIFRIKKPLAEKYYAFPLGGYNSTI